MECIIFGTGTAYLADVLAVMHRAGWSAVGFVEGGEEGVEPPKGVDPVAQDRIPEAWLENPVVVPVLTPWLRRHVEGQARKAGFSSFPALVDPSAVVAHDATVSDGALINAGVVIGANTEVGHMATVNRSASLGHDNQLGAYSFVGPGVTLAGRIGVGAGSVIGAGAVVKPGTVIGERCVVGLGSVVHRDVADGTAVLGNPARVVKRSLDEKDVVV